MSAAESPKGGPVAQRPVQHGHNTRPHRSVPQNPTEAASALLKKRAKVEAAVEFELDHPTTPSTKVVALFQGVPKSTLGTHIRRIKAKKQSRSDTHKVRP